MWVPSWRIVVILKLAATTSRPQQMKQFNPTTQPIKNESPRFISRSQLARRWSVSEMTIRRREMDGTLPKYSIGRGIRFLLQDVEAVELKARIA